MLRVSLPKRYLVIYQITFFGSPLVGLDWLGVLGWFNPKSPLQEPVQIPKPPIQINNLGLPDPEVRAITLWAGPLPFAPSMKKRGVKRLALKPSDSSFSLPDFWNLKTKTHNRETGLIPPLGQVSELPS